MTSILTTLFSVLVIACFWASFSIPLWEEWPSLKQSPWFLVTLLDLYIGFILFSLFTYKIKKNLKHSLLWTLVFCSLGNMATIAWIAIYRKDIYDTFN